MDQILTGIHQFHSQVFQQEREFFTKLATNQHPSALFIGCSDSRVDPSIITQAQLGDLFVLRNAGNIVPCHGASNGCEPATIEFAVTALDVKDIIVCGHSGCGAIQAMLDPSMMTNLPLVRSWLGHADATRRIMAENYAHLTGKDQLNMAVKQHVLGQIENLQTHPCVAAKLQRGALTLHAWIYQMDTGEVLAFSSEDGRFASLADMSPHEGSKRSVANPRKAKKKSSR